MVARTRVNQNSWLICPAPSEAGFTGHGWAKAGTGLTSSTAASGKASTSRRINGSSDNSEQGRSIVRTCEGSAISRQQVGLLRGSATRHLRKVIQVEIGPLGR